MEDVGTVSVLDNTVVVCKIAYQLRHLDLVVMYFVVIISNLIVHHVSLPNYLNAAVVIG